MKLDTISHTQVFRRLRNFPIAAIEEVFNVVVKRLGSKYRQKISKSLHGLNLIDASTITKSLKGMEWAKFRKSKAGIKLHLSLMYHDDIAYPNNVFVSRAKEHDVAYLKDLVVVSKNTINVFDRGYVDYQAFDQFADAGVLFVTRLKENAATWVIKRYEVDEKSKVAYHDLVTVGCGTKKTKNAFRYIQLLDDDGNQVHFITNVMDKTPEEIGDIYKLRWQIELFFKWIKQNLKIKHFYATSEQAVTVQIFIALIAYCLFRLISAKVDPRVSLRKIKSAVMSALFDPFRDIVEQMMRISPH
jgi:IS4 transposase